MSILLVTFTRTPARRICRGCWPRARVRCLCHPGVAQFPGRWD